MKKIVILLAFVLCIAAINAAPKGEGDVLKVGDNIPTFELKSDKYGEVKSTDLKGRVVLVTLFATWCGPCQKELAQIEKVLYPKYKDNPKFELLVVGREHTDAELEKYNDKKKFSFPIYPDASKTVTPLFATKYIPRTYLIDKTGKVVMTTQGYTQSEFDELMKEIENQLEK